MRIGYAKSTQHKDDTMSAKCCECGKKKRLPYWHWENVRVGGDYISYQCPDCRAATLEADAADYEERNPNKE